MKKEKFINLTGKEFGDWKILKMIENSKWKEGEERVYWQIRCKNCGNVFFKGTRYIIRKSIRIGPIGCDYCRYSTKVIR